MDHVPAGELVPRCRAIAASNASKSGLAARAEEPVKFLSYGERRQLELALALDSDPKVVLLDEPCAGLSPSERQRFSRLIRALPRDITLIMIEHDIDIALALADRVTVMHRGNVILDGTPDEVKRTIRCGRSTLAASEPLLAVRDDPHLLWRQLCAAWAEPRIAAGANCCIFGRNGMGKTTLIRSIAGLTPPRRGDVIFAGRSLSGEPPYAIAQAGMAIVPQGRRIFKSLTVRENLRCRQVHSPAVGASIRIAGRKHWTSERCSRNFRSLPSGWTMPAARLAAASSKCSRSGAR